MKILYSVEANHIIDEVPEFKDIIENETNLFDYYENIFIFLKKEDARLTEELLTEVGLFENQMDFYLVRNGVKGDSFSDFGIEAHNGIYLRKELLCAFSIKCGEEDSVQMASLQLQEHFVFKENSQSKVIYFIENHLKDLMKGIADAYDIEVSFFELDK